MTYEYQYTEIGSLDMSVPSSSSLVPFDTIEERLASQSNLPKNVCPKYCAVCNDKATGYHYEVASCNGCKTFFRRSVLGQKTFECKFDRQCYKAWPNGKRTFCRACRFKRCKVVGMNPNAISGAVVCNSPKNNESDTDGQDIKPVPNHLLFMQDEISRVIEQLKYLEIKSEKFRRSAYNPNPYEMPSLEKLVKEECRLALCDRLEQMPNWPLPQGIGAPRWEENSNRKQWLHFDLLGSIEYAKTFPFFHKLSDNDKVILMKAVSLSCTNLTQAFFSYMNKSDMLLHPDGTTVNLPPPSCRSNTVDKFVQSKKNAIIPMIRHALTSNEYVLTKAILLCNSSVANLSCEAVNLLNTEKLHLSKLLCTYCIAEFGLHGPARYAAIMSMLTGLEHISKVQKDFHCYMDIIDPPKNTIKLFDEIIFA